ncbi:hypothetical protein [Rhodanobacter glycinis]|jgi:hypothetical protein|nr:hypothetical protein [Rhodanobacter glycinis]
MSMTGNENQDAPDTGEEENNDSALQPEPDFEPQAPAPRTTTVPRIKPS